MFHRKINEEFDNLWDITHDLVTVISDMHKVIKMQSVKIHELEHYIDDVSVEVTELQEAVFEDDDEACDC